jgi:hypothetical protein
VAIGTDIDPVPVAEFTPNFSPIPRMAPPPVGREIDGTENAPLPDDDSDVGEAFAFDVCGAEVGEPLWAWRLLTCFSLFGMVASRFMNPNRATRCQGILIIQDALMVAPATEWVVVIRNTVRDFRWAGTLRGNSWPDFSGCGGDFSYIVFRQRSKRDQAASGDSGRADAWS